MSPLRLNGSTSGYSQLDAPAIAGDQTFTLPGTGGTIDRLNRAGNILQVVNATYSTQTSSSSSTYADTGLTATITPQTSSSKIIIFVAENGMYKTANNTGFGLRLLRDSSVISNFGDGVGYTTNTQSIVTSNSYLHLDSPATTSAVTYKTQFANLAAAGTITIQAAVYNTGQNVSSITLMEIAA